MDGREATHIDRQWIIDGCVMYPGSYSNDTEREQENVEAVVVELIKGKLSARHSWPSDFGFGRVPELLFKEKPEAYKPQMVSIGPFYHGQQYLQPMEARKIQYLDNFLNRNSLVKLENYVEAVTDLAERAYQCYPEIKIERKKFVMMMVVDGCFILELLFKYKERKLLEDESIEKLIDEYAFVDLILLENQLPFFVLEELYRVFNFNRAATDSCSFQGFICLTLVFDIMGKLFGTLRPIHKQIPSTSEGGKPRHLLDFVRQFLIPSSPFPFRLLPQKYKDDWEKQKYIYDKIQEEKAVGKATKHLLDVVRRLCGVEEDYPLVDPREEWNVAEPMLCATQLRNANVKFEINKNSTCLSDIKFNDLNGVLTIPGIAVYNCTTEFILRNLLANEIYTYDYSYITKYIVFLKSLISSGKDVELLQERGILKVPMYDPKYVAKLFDDLPKYLISYTEFTRPIYLELMKYSNKRVHKWKASLMFNYFNTPWALISVVAAIILLFLTVMQTIYAALSYHY